MLIDARRENCTRAMLAGFQMHIAEPADPVVLVATIASLKAPNN
jgi:hypothetical protein